MPSFGTGSISVVIKGIGFAVCLVSRIEPVFADIGGATGKG
jgi:hypothetical protein